MAYVVSDTCGFLIVRGDRSVWTQLDYDYPGVASHMGWRIDSLGSADCDHDGTDGTIDCPDCGLDTLAFINAAEEWIRAHTEEEFPDLDDYFL